MSGDIDCWDYPRDPDAERRETIERIRGFRRAFGVPDTQEIAEELLDERAPSSPSRGLPSR